MQHGGIVLLLAILFGHQFEHPKSIRLGIKPSEILIAINYDVNPGRDATQLRSLFDRDSDGALSTTERDKLAAYLEQMAMLFFRLKIDGEEQKLRRISLTPHRVDLPATAPDTLGVALLYVVSLGSREILLSIEDHERDKQKHVPMVVDLDGGWEVHLASQGELSGATPQRVGRIWLAKDRPLLMKLARP